MKWQIRSYPMAELYFDPWSQYLVRFVSLLSIIGGHLIYQPIHVLLPPAGIECTLSYNSASKVAELQVDAATLGSTGLLRLRIKSNYWTNSL